MLRFPHYPSSRFYTHVPDEHKDEFQHSLSVVKYAEDRSDEHLTEAKIRKAVRSRHVMDVFLDSLLEGPIVVSCDCRVVLEGKEKAFTMVGRNDLFVSEFVIPRK